MLNRRFLRMKVMQGLYALEHAQISNMLIAKDMIETAYIPDWNEKPTADYEALAQQKEQTLQLFDQFYQNPQSFTVEQASTKVREVTVTALNYYQNQLTRDKAFFAKNLFTQTDKIYDIYLAILQIPQEISLIVQQEKERIETSYTQKDSATGNFNLIRNPVIRQLRQNKYIESEALRRSVNWGGKQEILRDVFRNLIKSDPIYQEYDQKIEPSFEEEKEIVQYILKKAIFTHQTYYYFSVNELFLADVGEAKELAGKEKTEIVEMLIERLKESMRLFLESMNIQQSDFDSFFKPHQDEFQKYAQEFKIVQKKQAAKATEERMRKFKDSKDLKESTRMRKEKTEIQLFGEELIYESIRLMVRVLSDTVSQYKLNESHHQNLFLVGLETYITHFLEHLGYVWKNTHDNQIKIHITSNQDTSVLYNLFETDYLYWEEDSKNIQSMVQKTIRNIEENASNDFELIELTRNWEEDKLFYQDIFKKCIENEIQYEKMIAEKSQNWDIKRLALIDKIIIKMAICEMIHFYSIPVKVTINEYIELSKIYSTPKSKQYVNGVLDALSQDLIRKNIIRKSGKGLIDNN